MAGQSRDAALSAREAQVAALYVEGLSYKEIAQDLAISPGTVRTHLNAIYRKLAVSSRIELLHAMKPASFHVPMGQPAVVSDEPAEPTAARPERRQLTFLFADIVGSTGMASRFDVEDMHAMLSAYREMVRAIVTSHGGHAAGFPGDGAVAVFGWPQAREDAPERAASAALAIASQAPTLDTPDGNGISVRVGVATGIVVVESLDGGVEDFTGAAANLAFRLQTVAGPGEVIAAGLTRSLIGRRFAFDELPPAILSGLGEPVQCFRLRRELGDVSRFEARTAGRIRAPFVGREAERATLIRLWARAMQGNGGGSLIEGQAGIGKSRLAETLAETVETDGGRVLRLQAAEMRSESPLWPVRRIIEAEIGVDPHAGAEDRRRALKGRLAELTGVGSLRLALVADLLGIAADGELPAMSAARRRDLLLEALTDIVVAISRQRPTLLLIEDIHWIDPTSGELIDRLLKAALGEHLLVVLTTRPVARSELPALERIVLAPLPVDSSIRLVTGRAGDTTLASETVDAIVARSDGVPLFLEETTAAILEGAGQISVPASLRDTLAARLDRLGPAREIAQLAAAIGRDVDLDLLSTVLDDPPRAKIAAAQLVTSSLCEARPGGFTFSHALIQDAAYQSLLRSHRRELHARIAEAMLGRFRQRFAGEPELVALHLERAGREAAAIDYYLRASDAAGTGAAYQEAERYARRALELVELLPAGQERDRREVTTLLALGRATQALHGYGITEVEGIFQRALNRCRLSKLPRMEFPIVIGLAVQAAVSASGHQALSLAERAWALSEASGDPVQRAISAYALGVAHCWRGERKDAARVFAAGAEAYDESLHERCLALLAHDPGVVCLARLASNRFHMNGSAEEFELLGRALSLARRLGHPHSLNYCLHWESMLALEARKTQLAERAISETLDLATAQGFLTWISIGQLSKARLAAEGDDPEHALASANEALKALPVGGNLCVVSLCKSLVGEALRRLGRPGEALRYHKQAIDEIDAGGMAWGLVESLRGVARCRLALDGGETVGAEEALRRALSVARRQGSRILELRAASDLAELLLEQGEAMAAQKVLSPVMSELADAALEKDLDRARQLVAATEQSALVASLSDL